MEDNFVAFWPYLKHWGFMLSTTTHNLLSPTKMVSKILSLYVEATRAIISSPCASQFCSWYLENYYHLQSSKIPGIFLRPLPWKFAFQGIMVEESLRQSSGRPWSFVGQFLLFQTARAPKHICTPGQIRNFRADKSKTLSDLDPCCYFFSLWLHFHLASHSTSNISVFGLGMKHGSTNFQLRLKQRYIFSRQTQTPFELNTAPSSQWLL